MFMDDTAIGLYRDVMMMMMLMSWSCAPSCMFVFVLVSKSYKVYKQHQSIKISGLFSSHAGSVALVIMSTGSVAPAIMSN